MLTRRSLLGTTAVLAAGCSTVGNATLHRRGAPQDAEIKVAAFTRSVYLSTCRTCNYSELLGADNEVRYERALAAARGG